MRWMRCPAYWERIPCCLDLRRFDLGRWAKRGWWEEEMEMEIEGRNDITFRTLGGGSLQQPLRCVVMARDENKIEPEATSVQHSIGFHDIFVFNVLLNQAAIVCYLFLDVMMLFCPSISLQVTWGLRVTGFRNWPHQVMLQNSIIIFMYPFSSLLSSGRPIRRLHRLRVGPVGLCDFFGGSTSCIGEVFCFPKKSSTGVFPLDEPVLILVSCICLPYCHSCILCSFLQYFGPFPYQRINIFAPQSFILFS